MLVPIVGTAKGGLYAYIHNSYEELVRRKDAQHSAVTDIHFHNNILYDAGQYKKIFMDLEDETPLQQGSGTLRGLQFFENSLWYIDKKQGIMKGGELFEKKLSGEPRALAIYNNKLITALDFGNIMYVDTGEIIEENDLPVDDLESINGEIYVCGRAHEGFGYMRSVHDFSCKPIVHDVYGLAVDSLTGEVWSAGASLYKQDAKGDRTLVKGSPNGELITALELVPLNWLEEHLKNKKN